MRRFFATLSDMKASICSHKAFAVRSIPVKAEAAAARRSQVSTISFVTCSLSSQQKNEGRKQNFCLSQKFNIKLGHSPSVEFLVVSQCNVTSIELSFFANATLIVCNSTSGGQHRSKFFAVFFCYRFGTGSKLSLL